MRRKTSRLLALVLSIIMIAALMVAPISAASNSSGRATTSSSSSLTTSTINGKSYKAYSEEIEKLAKGEGNIVISAGSYDKEDSTTTIVEQGTIDGKDGAYLFGKTGSVSWTFTVPKAGKYVIQIEYRQVHETNDKGEEVVGTNDIERNLLINGKSPFTEAKSIMLSKVWQYNYQVVGKDENGNDILSFEIDGQGNDIRPTLVSTPEWIKKDLSDANGYYLAPFEFYFEEGENTITLESIREPIIIRELVLHPQETNISYSDYLKNHENKSASSNATIYIEAESPNKVSSVTMYPVYDRTSSITSGLTGPQSAQVTKYNTVGKEQWQTVGEWMSYEIDVKEEGFYTIVLRYKQDLLSGMYVSRKVYIDGKIPFAEAEMCRFPFTDRWQTIALNNGDDSIGAFKFYLTPGKHTIKLEATLGDMASTLQQVSETLTNINNCYLEILKLTGSDPDTNRTYNFSRVMPEVLKTMLLEANNLEQVYNHLTSTGDKGEKATTIEQIYILLRKMGSDESQIPASLSSLKSQIGSLGTWINSAKTQPLQVDYVQLQAPEKELPKADANGFQSLVYELKLFWYSFFIDYNYIDSDGEGHSEEVVVWVTTSTTVGRDEAQIIRNLSDNIFSPNEKITVNLKLVAGGTLLPSVLAGVGPDVSLMESSTTIIDYALRNALIPLNEFMLEDAGVTVETSRNDESYISDVQLGKYNLTWQDTILASFPEAASVPVTLYNYDIESKQTTESYYALPDTLSFSMMFYRKDVLESLGKDIDDIKTWDDLLELLPILQYNNMEIGIQNDIYTFVYQSGNEVYADNGLRINFEDSGVLNAFTKLCNMYTQYSLPYTYDFANRFRTGEMPIGIAGYTTCNQLSIFASEIAGRWGFVPLPGTVQTETNEKGEEVIIYQKDENGKYILDDDGNKQPVINNDSMASVTGCIMLAGCKNESGAWKFMKWYTGSDFQGKYSKDIVSIKGIAARPATANTAALKDLPWTSEEEEQIFKQFGNLAAVENHPGSYYLARYISFAFLAAYNDGKDPANALREYTKTIDKEIIRKRTEFGMDTIELDEKLDEKGNVIKRYKSTQEGDK